MRRGRIELVGLAVAVGLVVAACGGRTEGGSAGEDQTSTAPPSSEPRLADGTVPWVDLPAGTTVFDEVQPPTPVVGDDAGPCTADQLAASLPQWFPKGDNDEGRPRTTADGLLGIVAVRNTSDRDCTLQGEVPVTMRSGDGVVPVSTSHGINDEAKARITPLPAGGGASLRIDWDPPFCSPELIDQVIAIELPDDGGVVPAPVVQVMQPACTDAGQPVSRSFLSSSGFDIERASSVLDSAFNPVTVSVEAPTGPVAAGSELVFHVVLTNPTAAPLAFDPRPGYYLEATSTSDGTNEPINMSSSKFLNHLTIAELPPGATRFEIRVQLPEALGAGRDANLGWRPPTPRSAWAWPTTWGSPSARSDPGRTAPRVRVRVRTPGSVGARRGYGAAVAQARGATEATGSDDGRRSGCPKRMVFGPCGGVRSGGRCEVDDRPCPFVLDPAPAWPPSVADGDAAPEPARYARRAGRGRWWSATSGRPSRRRPPLATWLASTRAGAMRCCSVSTTIASTCPTPCWRRRCWPRGADRG